jgi:hypothetical protein
LADEYNWFSGFFLTWFDRLVRNNLGAAALPISGLPVGYVVIQSSRILHKFDEQVALLGYLLMVASSISFVAAMLILIISLAIGEIKRHRK